MSHVDLQADTVDMQNGNAHLEAERLAALDHDTPTTDELAHLAACAACRAERQAYQSLETMASAVRMPVERESPRLTSWESLSAQLRQEGLITSSPELAANDDVPLVERSLSATDVVATPVTLAASPTTETSRRTTPTWLRVAAAVVLVLGGGVLGRLSGPAMDRGLLGTDSAASNGASTRSASLGDSEAFASVQQASEMLYRAQRDYERASLWLASNDTTVHSSDVYRARLAALDQMMASSRAALRDAPSDPILNHYFQTASTAREATLKQLSIALPLDKTLERY